MINSKLREAHGILMGALRKQNLKELVKAGYAIFDAPIVVTNARYEKLSIYPEKEVGDEVYDTFVYYGEMDRNLLKQFLDVYLPSQNQHYRPFYVDYPPSEKVNLFIPRIFAILRDGDTIYGHMGILIEKERFQPWQIEVAELFEDFLVTYFKLSHSLDREGFDRAHVHFLNLMDPASGNRKKEDAREVLQRFFPGDWYLLACRISVHLDLETYARVILQDLRHQFPNVLLIIDGDYLFALEGGSSKTLKKIHKQLLDHGYSFHVSHRQALDYSVLEEFVWLADELFMAKQNPERLIYFLEEEMTHIAGYYFNRQNKADLFGHNVLRKIKSYDYSHDSEYFKTIRAYYDAGFDKAKTAKALHIHRNTLLYRNKRLKEIFDLDLDRPEHIKDIAFYLWLDEG